MKLHQRQSLAGWLFCLPIAVGLLLLDGIPLCMALYRSFMQGMTGAFVGLSNYIELFSNAAFRLAIRNTGLFWLLMFPLDLLLGLLLALLCNQANSNWLYPLLIFPALVPAGCTAAVLNEWLPPVSGVYGAAVLAGVYLWKRVGCTAVILAAAFHKIPREIREAAMLAGANCRQMLLYIQLPLLRPAMGVCLLTAFLDSFKLFRESYLLAGSHPDHALYGVPHFLYNNFTNMNYPRLAAASVMLVLTILDAALLVWLLVKRKERIPQ